MRRYLLIIILISLIPAKMFASSEGFVDLICSATYDINSGLGKYITTQLPREGSIGDAARLCGGALGLDQEDVSKVLLYKPMADSREPKAIDMGISISDGRMSSPIAASGSSVGIILLIKPEVRLKEERWSGGTGARKAWISAVLRSMPKKEFEEFLARKEQEEGKNIIAIARMVAAPDSDRDGINLSDLKELTANLQRATDIKNLELAGLEQITVDSYDDIMDLMAAIKDQREQLFAEISYILDRLPSEVPV